MFQTPTVFIVGAGASCEANLPSGPGLKKIIGDKLSITFSGTPTVSSGDQEIFNAFMAHPQGLNSVGGLLICSTRICAGLPYAETIDNYLHTHSSDKNLVLCGKLGIVRSILEAEAGSLLFVPTDGPAAGHVDFNALEKTWYMKFLRMLAAGLTNETVDHIFDNVAVVTFNYDRCIEHFLAHALPRLFHIGTPRAQAIVNKLRIFHVYGSVGLLPWSQDAGSRVEFGGSYHANALLDAAGSIRTFTETYENDALLGQIHEVLRQAEVAVYLGYAFHKISLPLLKPAGPSSQKKIFATRYLFSDQNWDVAHATLKDGSWASGSSPLVLASGRGVPCCEFLYDWEHQILL